MGGSSLSARGGTYRGYAPRPRRWWHKEPVVTSPARATDSEGVGDQSRRHARPESSRPCSLLLAARRPAHGLEAWAEVQRRGYEGLVAKDEASAYLGGRTRSWLKVKRRNGDGALRGAGRQGRSLRLSGRPNPVLAQGQASQWGRGEKRERSSLRLCAVQCGTAPLHAAGRAGGVPTLSRSVPAPGCARSPGIDVSPERIGRACPTCHRLARLSGHLTASRPWAGSNASRGARRSVLSVPSAPRPSLRRERLPQRRRRKRGRTAIPSRPPATEALPSSWGFRIIIAN